MKRKTSKLTLAAILVALSVVLSFTQLPLPFWKMGGSVTFGSMLPVMLLSLTLGWRWGLAGGGTFALFQLVQALIENKVFIWTTHWSTVVICVLFDYLVPFTVLGLVGLLRNVRIGRFRHLGAYLGITLACVIRFSCHYITGVVIWGQWAPEGMEKFLYSLLYNGSYMLPELVITLILAILLLESAGTRKLINMPVDREVAEN